MLGKTNTGGGGVGGVLTVTAPAGVTVEVSKDGKTKRKTANADGLAVFKGLATGTWTLTITNGSETSTKSVVITADYSAVIAFFSANISVTYPAGSTCTCSDGTTTMTAPDTSGTWICVVPNAGTWTVTASNGEDTTTTEVSITTAGQSESVELAYELYLYNKGDQCKDVTGGWTKVEGGGEKISFDSTKITFDYGTSGGRSAATYTVNKIDVSKYKTMVVTGKIIKLDVSGDDLSLTFGLTTTKTVAAPSGWNNSKTHNKIGAFEETLDISKASSSYYACLHAHGSDLEIYTVLLK